MDAGRPWAEINAVNGDLVFGAAGTVALTGNAVGGLQLFGSGHTVTFNGVISEGSDRSRYVEINGGNTAVFNAANTYPGNTDVYNGSTLQFAANGSAANSVVRLGNDDGSGVSAGAGTNTVSLINAAGGQNVSSTLVAAVGNGLLSSTNTSGTNTYSGGIYLDSRLGINATAAGGTFADGTTFDLVQSTALTGTFERIADGGFYSFGGQTFQAEYTSTDFLLVAAPEPATWLAGSLTLLLCPILRRRGSPRGVRAASSQGPVVSPRQSWILCRHQPQGFARANPANRLAAATAPGAFTPNRSSAFR